MTRRTAVLLPFLASARAWSCRELRRFPAPEANQAVAVDARHFFAIGNHVIGKYDKRRGRRVALWECPPGEPLIHLNSGIVRAGVLYCAHSNYPAVPMASSIEMWDAASLRHIGSHSFGIYAGSATWIGFRRGYRYVTFGHYGNRAAEPARDPRWTALIEFDARWTRRQSWVYPPGLIAKLGEYTISGGVFAGDGRILCTGHDAPEIYALNFPSGGSTLLHEATFGTPVHGQGIARDPSQPGLLYGIDRAKREVVVMALSEPDSPGGSR